jgi:hypothetical protein
MSPRKRSRGIDIDLKLANLPLLLALFNQIRHAQGRDDEFLVLGVVFGDICYVGFDVEFVSYEVWKSPLVPKEEKGQTRKGGGIPKSRVLCFMLSRRGITAPKNFRVPVRFIQNYFVQLGEIGMHTFSIFSIPVTGS